MSQYTAQCMNCWERGARPSGGTDEGRRRQEATAWNHCAVMLLAQQIAAHGVSE